MKKLSKILTILLIVSLILVALQGAVKAADIDDIMSLINGQETDIPETPTEQPTTTTTEQPTTTTDPSTTTPEQPATTTTPTTTPATTPATTTPTTTTTPTQTISTTPENNQTTNSINDATNQNIPKTGVAEDYMIGGIAVVAIVVSVFAFRKFKNYNV